MTTQPRGKAPPEPYPQAANEAAEITPGPLVPDDSKPDLADAMRPTTWTSVLQAPKPL